MMVTVALMPAGTPPRNPDRLVSWLLTGSDIGRASPLLQTLRLMIFVHQSRQFRYDVVPGDWLPGRWC